MFLIDAIKPKVEKKLKNCLIFRDCLVFSGGDLEAYKIKSVLLLFALGLLAATKTLLKIKEKMYCIIDITQLY